jgi:hypothetical protein
MLRRKYVVALVVLVAVVAAALFLQQKLGIAALPKASGRSDTFSGVYFHGFEHSDFFETGEKCQSWKECRKVVKPYWLEFNAGPPYEPLPQPCHRLVFEGELSPTGTYGHLGGYSRKIMVRKIKSFTPIEGCDHG